MKEQLIQLFQQRGKWTLQELEKALELKETSQYIDLMRTLGQMCEEKLIYNDHAKYIWIDCDKYFVGRLRDISRFEYMVSNGTDKIYVEKKNAKDCFDRDEVLVKRGRKKGNRVIHIYSHGIENVIGEFVRSEDGLKFRSDIDLHTGFKVVNQNEFVIHPGDKAVVQIVRYSSPLEVKITRLLGPKDKPGVDISAILAQNNIRDGWNTRVEKEIEKIPKSVEEIDLQGREDFRNLTTITIDGDSSKDFDDAISLERTDFGWRLYVHIADVSHYVQEGSAIDQEAYARGTSVYVADRVVPMLPFELSNGICSLNPDVDRLTMTAIVDIDRNGEIINSRVTDSVIHSDKRCTYSKVNDFLDGKEEAREEYKDIAGLLEDFAELAKVLQKQTKKRGSIEFATKEPKIVLDETGKPVDIYVPERGFAEQMIEEAMIRANVAVAHALNSRKLPGIYRVHAEPEAEKLSQVASTARAMGIPVTFNPNDATAEDISLFLSTIPDEKERDLLGLMALRAMQKAVYSQECIGHYGLALPEYSHFTSPIRRYPDLIMHRMLRKYILDDRNTKDVEKDIRKISNQSEHLSQKERDAIGAERAVDSYEMARYMSDKIGQKFHGTISGVTNFGFFVELPNGIEGLVPVRTLNDDFYKFDENLLQLAGEVSGKKFRLGDNVEIVVTETDVPKGLITFGLPGQDADPRGIRKQRPAC